MLVSIIHYGYDIIKCDHKEKVEQDKKPQSRMQLAGNALEYRTYQTMHYIEYYVRNFVIEE